MKRREFITLLGGAAAAWPLGARAQQAGPVRRIGILMGGAKGDTQNEAGLLAFTDALKALGWTEGHNIKIEIRWGAGNIERIQELAKEIVGLQPDLLVEHTTQPVAALQRETATIPIVFLIVSDPVGSGFVPSLPRPGGNITGFINIESSLGGKWIEVLKEVAPNVSRATLLFNPDTATCFNIIWSLSRPPRDFVGYAAQAGSQETGRWCVINAGDNARHCYFQRHNDCIKAISDGNGICVPNEAKRGEMLDDRSK